ncbi:MAG: glycogen/starch/alpha-glucan phosphorylase [Candidatus Cyclonatronum sp.]|uniref:glycogen/starch/alpha-glucan phosphorylase n=1 Tax=Cyclonatronum sp. TaxID=3024185 RepID=UPI0025C4ED70|nr:glycogen/starch/alpha-glucan phosphorylase [Cyclonatronum sp.]MCH8486793.1 glycogen/starch/alpha-glucan phosphorylase [Cyclonatronum sp.]
MSTTVSKKENIKTGMDAGSIKEDILSHLRYTLATDIETANKKEFYKSVVLTVMDRLHNSWLNTQKEYREQKTKKIYYISMEFLIGRLLDNALVNLNLEQELRDACKDLGFDYEEIRDIETDAALGNGGLGRLAACFLDSMATLGLAGFGYGIKYDYGIFKQKIQDGYQVERPDDWLRFGTPWAVTRPSVIYPVRFYGRSVPYTDEDGHLRFKWENTQHVYALANDIPMPGFRNGVVNNLRLWKATSPKSLDLSSFNQGEYINAVRDIELHENISRVLYPNDKIFVGQELRLKQEYFLVSSTLQDILREYKLQHGDLRELPKYVAIQCNDTHPNLAVPDLMRILMDEEGFDWETSWDITVKTLSYTNHTVLPEALEKWPVSMLRNLLPRHLQIIYEINKRFINKVHEHFGDDVNRVRRMSIISEGEQPSVQMANLGIVGTHKVNGVAALHTDLIKKTIFRDFYEMYPERFTNKTNGITPRRWLKQCNKPLADLITSEIGDSWITHLSDLRKLDGKVNDKKFMKKYSDIKQANKEKLAAYVKEKYGYELNTKAIFDIQIKRIHEYKRQLMLAIFTAALYNRIKANPDAPFVPRTVIFAGKAAPGYAMAKMFIKLINSIADKINNDPDMAGKLQCFFLDNYSVTLAEQLIPAADLSEQISTAGMEASGTGNMKFALNGALTIGTLDGANVEILEEVGEENIVIFGLTVEEVEELRRSGYSSWEYYNADPELKKVIDQIRNGFFSPENPSLFHSITGSLLDSNDYFLVMADYPAYAEAQKKIDALYQNPEEWFKIALYNTARVGKFSSDRTIADYATDIWGCGDQLGQGREYQGSKA